MNKNILRLSIWGFMVLIAGMLCGYVLGNRQTQMAVVAGELLWEPTLGHMLMLRDAYQLMENGDTQALRQYLGPLLADHAIAVRLCLDRIEADRDDQSEKLRKDIARTEGALKGVAGFMASHQIVPVVGNVTFDRDTHPIYPKGAQPKAVWERILSLAEKSPRDGKKQ